MLETSFGVVALLSLLGAITLRVIHVEMLIASYCSTPLRSADVL